MINLIDTGQPLTSAVIFEAIVLGYENLACDVSKVGFTLTSDLVLLMFEMASKGNKDTLNSLMATATGDACINMKDNTKYNRTLLHIAVAYGWSRLVGYLLQAGANPASRDFCWQTPLHVAVRRSDKESTRLLLRWGADPNTRDYRSQTPSRRYILQSDIVMKNRQECCCCRAQIPMQEITWGERHCMFPSVVGG